MSTPPSPAEVDAARSLLRYRLVPMVSIPDGSIVWCAGTKTLAVSMPNKTADAPPHTDTVCLSINDYRRVTKAIADAEEL